MYLVGEEYNQFEYRVLEFGQDNSIVIGEGGGEEYQGKERILL